MSHWRHQVTEQRMLNFELVVIDQLFSVILVTYNWFKIQYPLLLGAINVTSEYISEIQNCWPTKGSKEQASLVRLLSRAKASDRRELHPQALFIKFSFRFLLFFCYASFFYFFLHFLTKQIKVRHSLNHICENKVFYAFFTKKTNKYLFDCSSFA